MQLTGSAPRAGSAALAMDQHRVPGASARRHAQTQRQIGEIGQQHRMYAARYTQQTRTDHAALHNLARLRDMGAALTSLSPRCRALRSAARPLESLRARLVTKQPSTICGAHANTIGEQAISGASTRLAKAACGGEKTKRRLT